LSAEKKRRRFGPFAARFWLVAALIALVSALILGANLALLGYAQPRNDPVGQLTPARLMESEQELPGRTGTTSSTGTTSTSTSTSTSSSTTVTTSTTVTSSTTVTIPRPPTRHNTHPRSGNDD